LPENSTRNIKRCNLSSLEILAGPLHCPANLLVPPLEGGDSQSASSRTSETPSDLELEKKIAARMKEWTNVEKTGQVFPPSLANYYFRTMIN